jgi:uncharacterized membrane protein
MRLLLFTALLVLVPVAALAQESGGSFGGGDFGGGGGGGDFGGGGGGGDWGGGGGDWGGGGGGSWGGGGYSGGGGGGCNPGGLCCTVIMIGFFIGLAVLKQHMRSRSRQMMMMGGGGPAHHLGPPAGAQIWGQMDISAVSIAIDWRSRAFLQQELDRLAKSGDTKSKQGLVRLLRESCLNILRVERSWLYASVWNYHPMSPPQAEGAFRQVAQQMRSRYTQELVRSEDGQKQLRDTPEMRRRAEEGEGVVVVTVVVAARQELVDLTAPQDARQLKQALSAFGALNQNDFVAMEVIWSPAAENDRMSTAELEMLYPEMRKIDEQSIAGRVFCQYCHAPFAAELMKCPHCGAPYQPPGPMGRPT